MVDFNNYQKEVISLQSGRASCLASAGSGKTEVLTQRLVDALDRGVRAEDILCITFTNRAALSMHSRISEKVSEKQLDDIFIGNTHTLCLKFILKDRILPLGYSLAKEGLASQLWRICEVRISQKLHNYYDKYYGQSYNLARELIERDITDINHELSTIYTKTISQDLSINLESDYTELSSLFGKVTEDLMVTKSENYNKTDLNRIYYLLRPLLKGDAKKSQNFSDYVDHVKERIITFLHNQVVNIYETPLQLIVVTLLIAEEYDNLKDNLKVFDFDDVLSYGFQVQPKNYTWIQVDEAQDLSPLQWMLINYHSGVDSHVVSFGDMNQSIYRFLGASIEVSQKEIGQEKFELPENYRSPKNLVDFFNKYMSYNFPDRFKDEVFSNKESSPTALIHVHRPYEADQSDVFLRHAKKLADNNKSMALLCPSNAWVDKLSYKLNEKGIKHFRISQNDILESKNAMDFFAFLTVLHDPDNAVAWARLLWKFGSVQALLDVDGNKILDPQINALLIASRLVEVGGGIEDLVFGDDIYDHPLTRLKQAYETGYVFFDTETTGLSDEDNVIQLAGVRYTNSAIRDEIDLYCSSDKPVGDSESIHHISDSYLKEHGKQFSVQASMFEDYVDSNLLIAHNLSFDDRLMNSNIAKQWNVNESLYAGLPKICSLRLTKKLYPSLKSHKLADLIDYFSLDAVNSHNALDDVKAGACLIEEIKSQVIKSGNQLDALIDSHESVFKLFRKKFKHIYDNFLSLSESVDLERLFDLYFNLAGWDKNQYSDNYDELRSKLINWDSAVHKRADLKTYLSHVVPKLATLKESDLLTPDDNVVLSTVHRSKGLEFDYVLLPNFVVTSYPPYPVWNMEPSEEKSALIQEQQRLVYVAITRAKKQLVVGTYDLYYDQWGRRHKTAPCKFFNLQMYKMMVQY